MGQNQEGVAYRSILAGLLKNQDDLDLALQVAKKILGLPPTAPQPLRVELGEQASFADTASLQAHPGQFYAKSWTQAAAEVLKMVGKPQKTKTILEALDKAEFKQGGKNREAILYRSLHRAREFTKVAPDTWGLTEWYPDAKMKPAMPPPVGGRKRRGKRSKSKSTDGGSQRQGVRENQTEGG